VSLQGQRSIGLSTVILGKLFLKKQQCSYSEKKYFEGIFLFLASAEFDLPTLMVYLA